MSDQIEIDVIGGLCRLVFRPWVSTGVIGADASPGIGFDFMSPSQLFQSRDGTFFGGGGVIGRKDAAKLRDMLEVFLKNHSADVND